MKGGRKLRLISLLALLAPVEKIGRREKASDALNAAGHSVDEIERLGIAVVAGRALHQGQMAAGRGAHDADALGIDGVFLGVETG